VKTIAGAADIFQKISGHRHICLQYWTSYTYGWSKRWYVGNVWTIFTDDFHPEL